MELAKIKACICEGAAEAAIIDVLLDNDLLSFRRDEMLDEGVIRCRDGKTFETRYLRKGFNELISVIRILDSRRENFKLSKAYERCGNKCGRDNPFIPAFFLFRMKDHLRITKAGCLTL